VINEVTEINEEGDIFSRSDDHRPVRRDVAAHDGARPQPPLFEQLIGSSFQKQVSVHTKTPDTHHCLVDTVT
jgi:hypothetical protein